jgi:hypothetical protein
MGLQILCYSEGGVVVRVLVLVCNECVGSRRSQCNTAYLLGTASVSLIVDALNGRGHRG